MKKLLNWAVTQTEIEKSVCCVLEQGAGINAQNNATHHHKAHYNSGHSTARN